MIGGNRNLMTSDAPGMLTAQAEMASLQFKDISQSIFQVIEYVLGGRREKEPQAQEGSSRTFKDL